jgi:hypothetical protein
MIHNRDINTANNILNKSAGVKAALQTWRECKTSEISKSAAIPYEVSRVS